MGLSAAGGEVTPVERPEPPVSRRGQGAGVMLGEQFQPVSGHHPPVPAIVVRTPVETGELQVQAMEINDPLEAFNGRGDDFLPDAVTRDHCDAVRAHAVVRSVSPPGCCQRDHAPARLMTASARSMDCVKTPAC